MAGAEGAQTGEEKAQGGSSHSLQLPDRRESGSAPTELRTG